MHQNYIMSIWKSILINTWLFQLLQKKLGDKYDPVNLFLVDAYNYDNWFENEELADTRRKIVKEESDMPPLEGDKEESDMPLLESNEKVRERKVVKILTRNKLLTRLPILLAQIKAGNNSYKLKSEIKQILYLLYQHNKIFRKVYNNLIKPL